MMIVADEITKADYAFNNFIGKNKSSWGRINNVNGPYITDWL
jgi:hypothetical protein